MQDKLWEGIHAAVEQLVTSATAIWHLQRVAAKKRDPVTHACFLDEVCCPGEPLLTERYWWGCLRDGWGSWGGCRACERGVGWRRDTLGVESSWMI